MRAKEKTADKFFFTLKSEKYDLGKLRKLKS